MTDVSGLYHNQVHPAPGPRPTALTTLERPLRILMTCHSGGAKDSPRETFLRELSRSLCELGHSVDVICGSPYPVLDRRVRLVKMPSLGLYAQDRAVLKSLSNIHDATDIGEYLRFVAGLYAEPRSFGERLVRFLSPRHSYYDVVHDTQSMSYGLLALKRQGLPVIGTLLQPLSRDRDVALSLTKSWRKRLQIRQWYRFISMQTRVASRLDHLCTNFTALKDTVLDEAGGDGKPFHCIAPGINHVLFRPHPGTPRHPRRLVTTISPHASLQDLVPLLRALAELSASDNRLHLVIIGETQPTILQGLIRALGLEKRVEMTGKISEDERAHQFCEATLFIAWSQHESVALNSAEAMASETPVIAIDTLLLREIIGDCGAFIEQASAPALVHAIRALLDAPLTRAKLARQGYQRSLTHFDWRQSAQKYISLYRDALTHTRS